MTADYCIEGHPRYVPGCSMCEWKRDMDGVVPEPVADSLDAALEDARNAVAATLDATLFRVQVREDAHGWVAELVTVGFRNGSFERSQHATPAAALRALAAALRERQP